VEAVIHEASTEPRPILFIDEIHVLPGAGQAGGSMDAANILKPALARGAIRLIGATMSKEYRQTIEKDGALERRFQPLRIEEPTPEEAVVILSALRERLEKHHGVALDDDALRAAVEWSVRYLPDFRLPDKSLDLVDQACAAVRFRTLTHQEEKSRGETPLGRSGARRSSHHACHNACHNAARGPAASRSCGNVVYQMIDADPVTSPPSPSSSLPSPPSPSASLRGPSTGCG